MLNIRSNTFETNSSSVHTLVMCSDDQYHKWIHGELYLDVDEYAEDHYKDFVTFDEAKKMDENFPYPKSSRNEGWDWRYYSKEKNEYIDKRFLTYEEFFEDSYFETYHETYITDSKETVEAFGYFGHD